MIYKKLNGGAFARALFETEDLDPIYVMLARSGLEREQIARWTVASWCFYHARTACRIVEEEGSFWSAMRRADRERWARGTERRGFFGHKSFNTIEALAARYRDATSLIEDLASGRPTFGSVARKARSWGEFGPYFSFKVVDMLDRVLGVPVDVSDCDLSFEKKPYEGAALIAREETLPRSLPAVLGWLGKQLEGHRAPPAHDRPASILELETVLCKYKSHAMGVYEIGTDLREMGATMKRTPGWLAPILTRALPTPPPSVLD